LWSLGCVFVEIATFHDVWFDHHLQRARTADEVIANVADPKAVNFDFGLPNDVPGMSSCCLLSRFFVSLIGVLRPDAHAFAHVRVRTEALRAAIYMCTQRNPMARGRAADIARTLNEAALEAVASSR
jgi:hypothetical protein